MTTAIQRRRGTGAQHSSFTGLLAEITVDTTDNRLVVHDGVTAGGHPVAKESEVAGFATIASPTFTGVPAAPTAAPGTNTTQIATTAYVQTELSELLDGAPAALDTLNELAAALADDAAFATTVTNSLALKAPLASPALTGNPTAPTQSTADDSTKIATTAFVHDMIDTVSGGGSVKRNRVVNGDMRSSLENGTTSGTSNGYYAADQWATYRVTSAGTITSARVASVSPAGSPYRYRVTITTADSSLAAGEYLTISQNLEGSNVADFQYGGSAAKNSVLRFGFKAPAGIYAARLGNSAANRSYVSLFTISAPEANTDVVREISIPGDTTGTWLTADGVIGITLEIVLACGSTFQGTAGWQTGLILGTSGVSNGMATGSAVFELFDVGLKLDPDATGVYGQYEVGEVDAVYRSERYWAKSYDSATAPGTVTALGAFAYRLPVNIVNGAVSFGFVGFDDEMSKIPSLTLYTTSGASGGVSVGVNARTATPGNTSRKGFNTLTNTSGVTWTDTDEVVGHYIANARLS